MVSRLFVPQTFCSLRCPQLLQTVAPSELMEVKGRMVHVVTVRPWNEGNQDDEEIMLQLPAQLTQKDKVKLVNTLGVFYGILMFVKDVLDMSYYQIKSLNGETDTGNVELQPASLSLLTQDQLKERVGILTLGGIEEGTLFTVISTYPYIVGEGENLQEEILARVV